MNRLMLGRPPPHRRLHALLLALAVTTGIHSGCTGHRAEAPAALPTTFPVIVATAVKRDVPLRVSAIGNVEPCITVNVKPRIDGQLDQALFAEGQEVAAGDLLFKIDPRPFELAVRRAEANLARDQAQAELAKLEAQRGARLRSEGVSSPEEDEILRANLDALEAGLKADLAALEGARVQLGFCSIKAPAGGRTGRLLVHPGNIVKENETTLVVIHQLAPIYVTASIPEKYLGHVSRSSSSAPLKLEAVLGEDAKQREQGILSFVDNTVDRTTGTIRLKGTFQNEDRHLWPGQFVELSLILRVDSGVVVAPSQAVQAGQKGSQLYVVRADNTVELRSVVPGRADGLDVVLEKGLSAGERVVIDGQLRLVPNASVEVQEDPTGGPKHPP